MKFDLGIIGAGPAGTAAAEYAAEHGLSVVLFENHEIGGTCLNRGCIPTKALLHCSEAWKTVQKAASLGVTAENLSYNFTAMHARKTAVVTSLRENNTLSLERLKVAIVYDTAHVSAPHVIETTDERYDVDNIIIATGSRPAVPPIPGTDLPGVYTSDDLLEGDGVEFDSLTIIGGGVIGSEMACLYSALDTKIHIIEAGNHVLPTMDNEIAQRLATSFKKDGIKITPKSRVSRIEQTKDGRLAAIFTDKSGEEQTVISDAVLLATGRRANVEGLFDEGCQPSIERGIVSVDSVGRTDVEGLYVVGDAKANTIQLAHVAAAQAKNAVAAIQGREPVIDMSTVPSCVYANPEIASVGLTEKQAKEEGIKVKCVKWLAGSSGKCAIEGVSSGYIKLVCEAETTRLLGAQLVYPRATDSIGELAVAVEKKLTARELAHVIHPHPTFCEGIADAASMAY